MKQTLKFDDRMFKGRIVARVIGYYGVSPESFAAEYAREAKAAKGDGIRAYHAAKRAVKSVEAKEGSIIE